MEIDRTADACPDAAEGVSRWPAGARLGPYEIRSLIGAGAMGEVWRAVDTRLGREVALKVLPTEMANDPERMARFEREAKVLASLNHPNIAVLYGLEHLAPDFGEVARPPQEPATVHALVMELVEGPGLDELVARSPMTFDEAMPILVQITRALQEAHERGVVHRDLKPANVKIRPDGTVKVLDFGLATPRTTRRDGSQSLAPTMSGHRTVVGTMLGSAAYMSPEQTRGRQVDRRADIWAFGCVVYEVLSGRRAFEGDSLSDTLASVLRDEPAWNELPADLDPVARHVIRRCLAKDPDRRFHDIADVRIELEEAAGATVPPPRRRPRRRRWAIVAAVAAAAVGIAAAAAWLSTTLAPGGRSMPSFRALTYRSGHVASARFAPDGTTVVLGMSTADRPLALMATSTESIESRYLDLPPGDILGMADDGRMAVLLDRRREGSWISVGTLALADLVGGAPRPIAERVNDGDISPDGEELAVVREVGRIQRLEYPLGTTLFETSGWISHVRISPDGRRVAFLHHPHYGDDRGLVAVAEVGGTVAELTEELPDSVQGLAWWPDGRSVWFSAYVFGQGGVVWSVRPGEPRRETLRSPISVRLRDIAADGRLLLVAGDSRAEIAGLLGGAARERRYEGWNDDSLGGLSADGELFAGNMQVSTVDGEYAVYVRRADGPSAVRIGYGNVFGMSPDGRWVVTHKLASDRSALTLLPTGAGSPRVVDLGGIVPLSSGAALATSSSEGRYLAFNGFDGDVGPRIYVLDTDGGAVVPVGPVGTRGAVISPDGARVASLAPDGRPTVYTVDGGEAAVVASARAGEEPLQWSRDGRSVLVWDRVLPARIHRLGLADGTREPLLEVMPSNPAGVLYGNLLLSPGGEHYVYRYRRDVSTLYLVEGVR